MVELDLATLPDGRESGSSMRDDRGAEPAAFMAFVGEQLLGTRSAKNG